MDKIQKVAMDGWSNLLTGMGTSKDRDVSGVSLSGATVFNERTADSIYRSDGVGTRIIDIPADDMLREWISVTGDTENKLSNHLRKTLKLHQKLTKAIKWQDLFGGSVIVMLIDDGSSSLDQPLNKNNIKEIKDLQVYDRWRVSHTSTDVQSDETQENFGELEFIEISPLRGSSNNRFRVHTSRVLWFNNNIRTERSFVENNRWGDSIFTSIWKQLYRLDSSYFSTKNILDSFVTTMISVDNLQDLISAGREDEIKSRLNIMDLSRHTINAVILDSKETYEKKASSIAGLADALEKLETSMATVVGMPHTLLFGISPKGINATGEWDLRLWYDKMAARQENELREPIEKIIELMSLAKNDIDVPKDWSLVFNPLWQPTEQEVAETRKIQSETDISYIENGVVSPEEIRESRFGGEVYSAETVIDTTKQVTKPVNSNNNNNNTDKHINADGEYYGQTNIVDGHSHDFLTDFEGNGSTSIGPDGHIHPIVNGAILPSGNHSHDIESKERVDNPNANTQTHPNGVAPGSPHGTPAN